ncbi:hypothetical protein X797_011387 [Metarhizium robertsii]|uniref:Uncharacterized protein n=1 Tax=Metarhizium robertsii TaxID=568076 RepID=A0A014N702_9HYPO|nr:hypothetical protein X797_011387 [Metarhizium robertsii]
MEGSESPVSADQSGISALDTVAQMSSLHPELHALAEQAKFSGGETHPASPFCSTVSPESFGTPFPQLSSPILQDSDDCNALSAEVWRNPDQAAGIPVALPQHDSDNLDSHLGCFVQALEAQQADRSSESIELCSQTFFNPICSCGSQVDESEHTHSLREAVEHLQSSLPPLSKVFGESGSYIPRHSFQQWQRFLSEQPGTPLSFRKSEGPLPQRQISISRQWDIDSVWLGAKGLQAIRPPNDFRLSFLPSPVLNLSTEQVIQPHGLNLAKTRHILLGTFSTHCVRFSAFVFSPNAARCSSSKSIKNALSLERQKDLYDHIIIPAANEAIQDPSLQEIPRTYEIAYAKSRSYQEKPGNARRCGEDVSRSYHLQYVVPARYLLAFWQSIARKAGLFRLQTQQGSTVAYFKDPQLLFQSHYLKNTFGRATLEDSLNAFQEIVLHPSPHGCPGSEPYTLLWKSQCHRHLHQQLCRVTPDAALDATYFRGFLLRDVGDYQSKASTRRVSNPGRAHQAPPGIIRAKAYSCNKELVSVMFSNYNLFGSGTVSLLALNETMIEGLSSTSQEGLLAPMTQPSRDSLFSAWEANKRHVLAISEPRDLVSYGVRKEMTFRFGSILMMWNRGYFDPSRSPHASRFIVPLDHLFHEAALHTGSSPQSTLAFYTAQLLCRLLKDSLNSEQQFNYDNWIWLSKWRVQNREARHRGSLLERQGLGLDATVGNFGMLWIPRHCMDWRDGHIALGSLVQLYIPRTPGLARIINQTSVQSFTTSMVSVELCARHWLQEARHEFGRGRRCRAEELVENVIWLSVEEVARSYQLHLLSKLRVYWNRVFSYDVLKVTPPLRHLEQARDELAVTTGQIVTAQTVLGIYDEAWAVYWRVHPDGKSEQMPREIPCWMGTRKHVPPKDGWSDFIFRHPFDRPSPPTWNGHEFLGLYRKFKEIWEPIREYAGPFDHRFCRMIGRYILVSFNSDQGKEMDVVKSHIPPGPLGEMSPKARNQTCRRAMQSLVDVTGPQWLLGGGLVYILPWNFQSTEMRDDGHDGPFRVPVSAAASKFACKPRRPTVLLPSRHNAMALLDAIQSLHGLSYKTLRLARDVRKLLSNDGQQYDIRSHFAARQKALGAATQPGSLLRQFLSQSEPPQKEVNEQDDAGN